jgi:hypothetical protein
MELEFLKLVRGEGVRFCKFIDMCGFVFIC